MKNDKLDSTSTQTNLPDIGRSSRYKTETTNWPDQISDDAFVGLAGEVVGAIEPHSEADNVALLIQFLVGFGNIIGRNCYSSAQATRHHSNLFVALVGKTAKARKGSSWGPVSHVLSAVDPHWFHQKVTSGLTSGEGLTWHVRDPFVPIKGPTDPGISDKRLLVIEEEFASVLKVIRREGNTLSPLMRSAWDGKALRSLNKKDPTTATDAHISVIGHITWDELKRCLTETESANGFGNRFLWICVKRSKLLPDGGAFEEENLNPLISRLKEVVEFAKMVCAMKRDNDATKMWNNYYEELSEGEPGLLGSMTARREAQTLRLSQIYAILDSSKIVTATHLKAAMAVEKYAFDSSRLLFGEDLGNSTADTVMAALRLSPDGLTRSEISRKLFQRNKPESEISQALSFIEANGYATRRLEPGLVGRAKERWMLKDTTLTT